MNMEVDIFERLTPRQKEAYALAESAIRLDQARMAEERAKAVVTALDYNLKMWVMISTLAQNSNSVMSDDLRENLIVLSRFVSAITLRQGSEIDEASLDTLININFQLAEGLLEGDKLPGNLFQKAAA